MAKYLVVNNPNARRGHEAMTVLQREGALATAETQWVPLTDLASLGQAGDWDRLIVIGGDGTINAAVDWVVRTEQKLPLGIVPAGTGNNLASGLGLPMDWGEATTIATSGERLGAMDVLDITALDTGQSRVCLQSAILGFPADIAHQYDTLRQRLLFRVLARPLGTYIYRLLAGFGLWRLRHQPPSAYPMLSTNDSVPGIDDGPTLALFVGNESSLGGDFYPCPNARIDDGKLDVCIIRPQPERTHLRVFRAIAKGEHLDFNGVDYTQTSATIKLSFDGAQAMVIDGDGFARAKAFKASVLPGRLSVVKG